MLNEHTVIMTDRSRRTRVVPRRTLHLPFNGSQDCVEPRSDAPIDLVFNPRKYGNIRPTFVLVENRPLVCFLE